MTYGTRVLYNHTQLIPYVLYGNTVLDFYLSYLIRIFLMLSEYTRHVTLKYRTSTLRILYVCFPYYILLFVTPTYEFHTEGYYMTYNTRVLHNHTLRIPYVYY